MAENELGGNVELPQIVHGRSRHRAGQHISAHKDQVEILAANVHEHGLQRREIGMNVVDGRHTHRSLITPLEEMCLVEFDRPEIASGSIDNSHAPP